ncbi:MAG TPA: phospholipase D family protein [Candidatus Limnocylindria bacterium]|jgi:hypothetical protein|nr:phospholipase D family protein [Candidatus Limnocylindria bacterium]
MEWKRIKKMNSSFQLIDTGWDKAIYAATMADRSELCVVCPFIKVQSIERLLAGKSPEKIRVITRFHLGDMCDGVSDTEALRLLLKNRAKIRGVRNLHAKVYLFGTQRAIVTSANLTEAALLRNHEFGFVSNENGIITRCREYFDTFWKKAGPDLDLARLEEWERRIESVRVAGSRPSTVLGLSDEGINPDSIQADLVLPSRMVEAPQSFVKFFGEGRNRASLSLAVFDEVQRSGCHWACSYPKNKRPRQVEDGAVLFMGRLVGNPNDTVIYGRAIGLRHVEGRDEASIDEIKQRTWKETWPIYVRVHHAEFIAGTLANGIRLSDMMDELKSDSFLPTQKNARGGGGNTEPRGAYRQQAAIRLTNEAFAWLNHRLEAAFALHGKLTPAELESLDWPLPQFQRVQSPAHLPAYVDWSQKVEGRKSNTAREYAYFLKRCATHYGESINEQTVRDENAANVLLQRVMQVVNKRGRWAGGTFNEGDVTQNLTPALRAYGRFIQATLRNQS